jgi:uncharacterized membrane protein (TIGR02234 family)
MAEPRQQPSRFGPVVLGGLGSAAVVAVFSARDWFKLGSTTKVGFGVPDDQLRADMPLALALALVLLAAWGVVLVSGPRTRRLVLALAALATVGLLACLVVAPFTLPDDIRAGLGGDDGGNRVEPTASYLVVCVAAPFALALVLVAWRFAPRWPQMSSRYDAPATASVPDAPAEELADRELWKALDEGRDPTQT